MTALPFLCRKQYASESNILLLAILRKTNRTENVWETFISFTMIIGPNQCNCSLQKSKLNITCTTWGYNIKAMKIICVKESLKVNIEKQKRDHLTIF